MVVYSDALCPDGTPPRYTAQNDERRLKEGECPDMKSVAAPLRKETLQVLNDGMDVSIICASTLTIIERDRFHLVFCVPQNEVSNKRTFIGVLDTGEKQLQARLLTGSDGYASATGQACGNLADTCHQYTSDGTEIKVSYTSSVKHLKSMKFNEAAGPSGKKGGKRSQPRSNKK